MESEPHGTTIMGFRNDAGYILAHDGFITVMHKKVHKGEPKYTITETDANKYYHLAPKPNAITAVTSGLSRRMECLCEEVMKINTAKLKAGKPRGSVYETVQICEEKLYELGKLPMPRKDIVNSMIIGGFDGNTAVLYHVSQHSWNPRKVKRPIAKRFNSFWVIGGDVTTRRLIESFKLDHLTPIRIVAAVIKSAMYDASIAAANSLEEEKGHYIEFRDYDI